MEIISDVGQTLSKPWRHDIPTGVVLAVIVLFAIVVWFTFDSLNLIGKLEAEVSELIGQVG